MRKYFLLLWNVFDPFYFMLTRLEYIDPHSCVFRVRIIKYKGKDIILSDGTLIKTNDKFVKLHLHNAKILYELQSIPCSIKRGRIIFRKILISMPTLTRYIYNHKNSCEIKGIMGLTMLHKGAERLGFDIVQPSNIFYRNFKKISQGIIYLLSSEKTKLSNIPNPCFLFISKEKLLQTYK